MVETDSPVAWATARFNSRGFIRRYLIYREIPGGSRRAGRRGGQKKGTKRTMRMR